MCSYFKPTRSNQDDTGSILISDHEDLLRVADNALARIVKCIPPTDIEYVGGAAGWRLTNKQDHNGFKIFQSLFHTCGVESWNSIQTSFTSSSKCAKELAAGLMMEGNAMQIMKKDIRLGKQEDIITYNPTVAYDTNKWAGFEDGTSMHRLYQHKPYAIVKPPPKAAGETVVLAVGRLDVRTNQPKPRPTATPQLALPRKTQLLLPALPTPPQPAVLASQPATSALSPTVATPLRLPVTAAAAQPSLVVASQPAVVPQPSLAAAVLQPSLSQNPLKRQRDSTSTSDQRPGKQNRWCCSCTSEGPSSQNGGKRASHGGDCPRSRWEHDRSYPHPSIGEVVVCNGGKHKRYAGQERGAAYPSKGALWVCDGCSVDVNLPCLCPRGMA
jgi:hypothetical protein